MPNNFFRFFSKYKKLILDNLHLIWYINHVAEIQQDATIAQVVERIIGNDEVTGPTPVSSLFLCFALQKRNARHVRKFTCKNMLGISFL